MFSGVPKEPPCDDIVILSRSQPIAAIRFGSLSRSRNSSNNNISLDNEDKRSENSCKMEAEAETKPIAQADSGTFSREDSCERLSSFSDSNDNHSTANLKSGVNCDLSVFRTSLQDQQNYKKAKKIKVFRNGDRLFAGMNIAVSTDKFKTMTSLLKELTRVLSSNTSLRDGVRALYSTSGVLIEELEQLLDGECYVAGSKEAFIPIDYESLSGSSWNATSGKAKNKDKDQLSSILNEKCGMIEENREFIKPRVITVVQNGSPRNVSRLLLNKKTAFSFEQVLRDINDSVKLDCGAVRKVFTLNGTQVTKLAAFFGEDEVFIACGNERLKPITDEDLVYINEKVSIGAKSPVMGRRKSLGAKSPMMSRRGSQPGMKSPQMSRRSSEMSTDFSALKVLDAMRHEDF